MEGSTMGQVRHASVATMHADRRDVSENIRAHGRGALETALEKRGIAYETTRETRAEAL
jgi:hypothetical protein